jgi:hypothetical protein
MPRIIGLNAGFPLQAYFSTSFKREKCKSGFPVEPGFTLAGVPARQRQTPLFL